MRNNGSNIEIFFPERKDFIYYIDLPPNFPIQAPLVFHKHINGKDKIPLDLPITQKWLPLFQIVNIIRQIQLLISVPFPPVFQLQNSEIEAFVQSNPQIFTRSDLFENAISSINTVKIAMDSSNKAIERNNRNKEDLNFVKSNIDQKISLFQNLISQRKQLQNSIQSYQGNQQEINKLSLKQKIINLENQINSFEQIKNDLKQKYLNGEILPQDYFNQLIKENENFEKNKIIVQELKKKL